MSTGDIMFPSCSYWWSSDSDSNNYITPIGNTMTRKKKQIRFTPVKNSLNAWQTYTKSNYDRVRSLPNKERFKKLSEMHKIDNIE